MRKYLLFFIALCLHIAARGQTVPDALDLSWLPQPTQAKALRYWIDDDIGNIKTTAILNGRYTVDVSSLLEGLHTIHFQIIDNEEKVAIPYSGIFLKMQSNLSSSQASTLRYWFDDDTSISTCNANVGTQLIDVSTLLDGLHTLHYQVVDKEGNVSYVASGFFLKMQSNLSSSQASTLRYWFDDDTSISTCNANVGTQLLNVSTLLDGLHTLHYQVVDKEGKASYIASSIFLKTGAMTEAGVVKAEKLIYWFDDEATLTTVDMVSGAMMLDASNLLDGLHTVHYMVVCNDGSITSAYSSIFLRMNIDVLSTTAQNLRYWFDDKTNVTVTEIAQGTQMLNASHLLDGLHTIHYQIVDNSGAVASPYSSIFLKMAGGDTTGTTAKSLRYWFNEDKEVKKTSATDGTQVIDVSDLLAGLHTLHYQLVDSNGEVSSPTSRIFIKNFDKVIAGGENRITKYQYWLNKNSQAMQTVELTSAANPYQLIALLPMQKEPIHSDCFHFEVTNGEPMVYAKNIIHLRFYDAQGYFSDGEKPFVDYSVKQEISAEQLESGIQATTAKPEANAIKWYRLEAEPGDSLQFKLDRAASIQLFAPSGKEVYSVSGAESVNWGGLHVSETGTYYLALHDVTATYGNTVSIDYNHIDKYAVLRQDVALVGNGGCSTITFEGNGFRDLYAIDLYNAKGDTIKHVYIGHESDATTSVVFDFTGAEIGKYHAVFHFTTEDKKFTNLVTVEEAKDIELATTVTYPSTFLRGTSTTYTIKITNKGNMTAYNVPLEVKLRCSNFKNISKIHFLGDVSSLNISDESQNDSLDDDVIQFIRQIIEEYGCDVSQFVVHQDSIDSYEYGISIIFCNIPPNTTKYLSIEINSSSDVSLSAYMSTEWYPLIVSDKIRKSLITRKRSPVSDWLCCYRERIECVADAIATLSDKIPGVPPNVNCGIQILNTVAQAVYDIGCSEGENMSNRIKNYAKAKANSLAQKIIDTSISCVTKYFKLRKEDLREQVKNARAAGKEFTVRMLLSEIDNMRSIERNAIIWVYSHVRTAVGGAHCVDVWRQPVPNCPPNPGGGGGSSTPVPPSDPNDIYGYLSDAGSKFIADSVAKVNYTIEFENGTTFAKASAHTIVIKDTLDSRYFDLKSFLPTSIKLGSRETFLNETDVKTKSGITSFLKTIDMRPEINAIAQVEGTYSQKTGIAEWRFTSLDPMTMEATDDLMQGILPVNYDGTSGIGEVMYEIGVKPNKADGTEIPNRAGIVFDYEDAIMTPTWTNIVDATSPKSRIADVAVQTDSTATVSIEASDELSGVWRYDVYVQYGTGSAWFKAAENVPADTTATVKIYEGINHGFYVVATDSAGNVERKEAMRELSLNLSTIIRGDANCDQAVDVADVVAIVNKILGEPNEPFVEAAADVNGDGKIDVDDVVAVVNIILEGGQQNAREMMRALKACGFRF